MSEICPKLTIKTPERRQSQTRKNLFILLEAHSLREKCPNMEKYRMRKNTDQKKLRIWKLFTQ